MQRNFEEISGTYWSIQRNFGKFTENLAVVQADPSGMQLNFETDVEELGGTQWNLTSKQQLGSQCGIKAAARLTVFLQPCRGVAYRPRRGSPNAASQQCYGATHTKGARC